MSEAHRTRLDREMHARLVAAYRVTPGNHTAAARASGLDRRTAQKGWEQGFSYEWARTPIRDLIAAEQAKAREMIATEGAPAAGPANVGQAAPAPPPRPVHLTPAQAVVSDAAESRKQEAQLARMTRNKALLLSAAATVLLTKGAKLADRLGRAIEQRFFAVGADGKEVLLSLEEIESGVRLIEKLATLSERTAAVGLTSMKMEEALLGRAPTTQAEVLTRDQALRACKEAGEAYQRAEKRLAERGMHVVQGGRGAAPARAAEPAEPLPLASGDDKV